MVVVIVCSANVTLELKVYQISKYNTYPDIVVEAIRRKNTECVKPLQYKSNKQYQFFVFYNNEF